MKRTRTVENISAAQRRVRQLPANFQPADTSPQLAGPYPGRNATRGYLVGEGNHALDRERREQQAYDRERQQFKHAELTSELGADSGPVYYVKLQGGDAIRDPHGQPKKFPSHNAAAQAAMRYMRDNPGRRAQAVNIYFDEPIKENLEPTYEDILTDLRQKLGDYLQDVATHVRHDSDLSDRDSRGQDFLGPHIKTRHCHGRPFGLHGDQDRGFHITLGSRRLPQRFATLAEAEMALEIWSRRPRPGGNLA